jgi:pilus assembly protein Flp/PilA
MIRFWRLVGRVEQTLRGEDGQGLAEYALILALIAIVAVVALIFMGSQVSNKLSIIGTQLQSVAG